MKLRLFQVLRYEQTAKRPCAVVTDLASGAQAMVTADGVVGVDAIGIKTVDGYFDDVRKRIAADRSGTLPDTQLFVRVYSPPPRMVIVGAVHIAQSLAPMAKLAGFDVTVIDPREAFVRSGRLADITAIVAWPDEAMKDVDLDVRTAVVTLTHDPKLDDPALAAALNSPAFYIGALGSTKTHAKRLQRLKGDGFTDTALARIHGPVGLDIDAVTPAEIAVSIMAQVIATLRAEVA